MTMQKIIPKVFIAIILFLSFSAGYANTSMPHEEKSVIKETKKQLKNQGYKTKETNWGAIYAYDKEENIAVYTQAGQQALPFGKWGEPSLVHSLPLYFFHTDSGVVNMRGQIIVPKQYSSQTNIELLGEYKNGESMFIVKHIGGEYAKIYSTDGTLLVDLPKEYASWIPMIKPTEIDGKTYYFFSYTHGPKMLLNENFKPVFPHLISNSKRGINKKPITQIGYYQSPTGLYFFVKSSSAPEKELKKINPESVSPRMLYFYDMVYDANGKLVLMPERETPLEMILPNGYLLLYDTANRIDILTDLSFKTILMRRDMRVDGNTLVAPNERFTFRGKSIKYHNPSANELALADEHAKQQGATSTQPKTKTISPVRSKDLPSLEIVDGSVRFIDPSGKNAIEAGSSYTIEFTVRNKGKGDAELCEPKMTTSRGFTVAKLPKINLPAGAEKRISAKFSASNDITAGKKTFVIAVDEPHGFGTDSHTIEVNAHAFTAPLVVVNDFAVSSSTGVSTLQRKVPFDLQLLLQNIEAGTANDVVVTIELPDNVFVVEGEQKQHIASLKAGETYSLNYTLVANNAYTAATIPVNVRLSEKYGKYTKNRTIELGMNQALAATKTTVSENISSPVDIKIASLTSEVDREISRSGLTAPNTFAVIISNETYMQVDPVDYAANDGQVFARYCTDVLGLPQNNVHYVVNATRNQMVRQLNWLKEIGNAYGQDADVIFYYSGHGVPSESDKTAYLLPVDGDHADMSTNLELDQVYRTLAETGVAKITVLLDACFSGSKRGDSMLKAARGVKIKPKNNVLQGPIVVLSAAQGDQTAYPLDEERHGMFTFYLLKKLRDTAGNVTLGDLADYITTEVSRRSVVENSKSQTPAVQVSAGLADSWRTLRLTK